MLAAKTTGIAYETVHLIPRSVTTPRTYGVRLQVVWLFKSELTSLLSKLVALVSYLVVYRVYPKREVTIIGWRCRRDPCRPHPLGLGAQVTILDISAKRLSVLEEVFGHQIQTLMSNSLNIEASVRDADVVIGAVLIPGAKAPKLVTDEMVKQMRPGSVIVDVAVDQGALSRQLTV